MPKTIYRIANFEGGINNKANQRDIAENQLVTATGVDLSVVGGIKMGGSALSAATIVGGADPNATYGSLLDAAGGNSGGSNTQIAAGQGLFVFRTDYSLQNDEIAGGTSVLAMVCQDYVQNDVLYLYDPESPDKWNDDGINGVATSKTAIDLGGNSTDGGGDLNPAFYFSSNGLRVSAGTNGTANINKCLYYSPAVNYFRNASGNALTGHSDEASYTLAAGWYLTDQEIKAPPSETRNLNLIAVGLSDANSDGTNDTETGWNSIIMHRTPSANGTNDGFDNNRDRQGTPVATDLGVTDMAIAIVDRLNNGGLGFSYDVDTSKGTWTGIWAIYHTYVYYDMDFGAESPVKRIEYGEIHSGGGIDADMTGGFMVADWTDSNTPVATALDNDTIKFRIYIRTGKVSDANSDGTMDTSDDGAHNFPATGYRTSDQSSPDARIVGMRVYARRLDRTSIGTPYTFGGDYLHLVDISFKDGVRKFTDKHYTEWGDVGLNTFQDDGVACCPSDGSGAFFEFENPPSLTYQDINGYPADDIIHAEQYKTAVVINRQAYIGNVRHNETNYPDRIMVSPLDKPDVFPRDYFLDIASNDGDDIIHLESHGDRLFCFKRNKLFIINVANYDAQYLEAEYDNMGVSNGSQVAKMPTGIVWVNDTGCWIFDGSNVNNTIKGKIDQNTWASFLGTVPSVGYDAKSKNIIVLKDCSASTAGDVYILHTETNAWTFHDSMFPDAEASDTRSNFISVDSGIPMLWWFDADNGENHDTTAFGDFLSYSSAAADNTTSGNVVLLTKDMDFGQPAQRKKIYKVYVTYKCADIPNVQVKFDVNGITTCDKVFKNGTNFSSNALADTDDAWAVAVLEPNDSSEVNNIYSFQLKFTSSGTVDETFAINDISVVYRGKKVN
jgi:hypothetical protein